MSKIMTVLLLTAFCSPVAVHAAPIGMDDKVARWPRATTEEKVDFATRLGKAFSRLSPELDQRYFMSCLEETANIGNPRDIKIEEAVKLCVSVKKDPAE